MGPKFLGGLDFQVNWICCDACLPKRLKLALGAQVMLRPIQHPLGSWTCKWRSWNFGVIYLVLQTALNWTIPQTFS